MQEEKALIAMSGGVDSSIAAYLTQQAGFDCIGVTMKLFDNEDAGISTEKSCCSLDDVLDARKIAYKLGIPFYVFNFKGDFRRQVIDRFISAYEQGATPNPCIDCNHYLKFDRLYRRALELECSYIVTGHYARIEESDGRYLLKKAVDDTKDQSYMLYTMTQQQLKATRFPLGGITKTRVRAIAEEEGFVNARKADSQDICFVPDGDYAKIIRQYTGKTYPPGDVVDTNGNVLGKHKGIIHYTVGQRKGLGLSFPHPMYVSEIRPETNTVVLGQDASLYKKELSAKDFNWIAFDRPVQSFRAKAKIRYKHSEQWACVLPTGDNTVKIIFDEPQRAITPGQAVVLYDSDTVLGGGIISKAIG